MASGTTTVSAVATIALAALVERANEQLETSSDAGRDRRGEHHRQPDAECHTGDRPLAEGAKVLSEFEARATVGKLALMVQPTRT